MLLLLVGNRWNHDHLHSNPGILNNRFGSGVERMSVILILYFIILFGIMCAVAVTNMKERSIWEDEDE